MANLGWPSGVSSPWAKLTRTQFGEPVTPQTYPIALGRGGGGSGGVAAPVWPNITFCSDGVVNTPYSQQFDLAPASSPTTFTVVAGALPTGLALANVLNDVGTISGTPTIAGTFNFTLRATNSIGTADKAFTIIVVSASGGGSFTFVS